VHTTYFAVPAATKVNITIYGYDGCTPLRNPVWGRSPARSAAWST
jgi:hypothetical protein